MSIISEVKCARCDRTYSGVRSRCPYCGARRIGTGKYSEDGDNSKGKMVIGVLILAVLVVAAAVLLFTAPRNKDEPEVVLENTESVDSPNLPDENENVSVTGVKPPVPPSDEPEETESETPPTTPTPRVTSVVILYAKNPIPDNDFTAGIGDRTPLSVRIEPAGVEYEGEVVWLSSNTSIFEVVKESTDGTSAAVTGYSAGTGTLTVIVGGVEAECTVRIK